MRRLVASLVVIAALGVGPAAWADSSTVLDGYGSNASKAVVQVKDSTPSTQVAGASAATTSGTPAATSGGTLPFTGSDLTIVAIAGIALVALGFGLRRLGRNDS